MDELGFDVLWTAEHHFQREGYEVFPNLIQLGLWLATQTKRLKFGCGFNVLPSGIRSVWPRTTRWPTPSPTGAS